MKMAVETELKLEATKWDEFQSCQQHRCSIWKV